jgi:hypothetical protein
MSKEEAGQLAAGLRPGLPPPFHVAVNERKINRPKARPFHPPLWTQRPKFLLQNGTSVCCCRKARAAVV